MDFAALATPPLPAPIAAALADGLQRLRPHAGQEAFDPEVPSALLAAGLQRLPLPIEAGGLGAGTLQTTAVLAALGAVDGSAALGLAMHCHSLGAARESGTWPAPLLARLYRSVVEEGALVNVAATEDAGGSPARGALPDTTARRDGAYWVLDGEKSWTTWLPALRYAIVSARLLDATSAAPDSGAPLVGQVLLDLNLPGVERQPAFDALGMRASASGRLRLRGVRAPGDHLIAASPPSAADPRRVPALGWFGLSIAAVYLGVGEGAAEAVLCFAKERKPGDHTTAVADVPSVRIRLGRLWAELRAARLLMQEVAGRWDAASPNGREALLPDVALVKIKATAAAVTATDEALRIAGGPGFVAGPLERRFRDARAGLIHPPLEDIAYQDFARLALEHLPTKNQPLAEG
ncbi:acyl-CoA dehydrogenase family protein [Candidatus Methylocalor cossyra]|uniref:Acyl-CoA dehydrogenase YdbM n=1 Tax=Candidatus Methylocalor cossyra TaxID=3108543 RepID=A0ABM9NL75_9GAMM